MSKNKNVVEYQPYELIKGFSLSIGSLTIHVIPKAMSIENGKLKVKYFKSYIIDRDSGREIGKCDNEFIDNFNHLINKAKSLESVVNMLKNIIELNEDVRLNISVIPTISDDKIASEIAKDFEV